MIIAKHTKKVIFLPDLHSEMSQLLPNSLGYQRKESTEICKYLKTSKQIPGEEGTKKKWGKGCQWIQRCHRLGAAFLKSLGSSHQGQPRKAMAWGHPQGPALKHTWTSKASRGCAGCDVCSSFLTHPALTQAQSRIFKCSLGSLSGTTKQGQLFPSLDENQIFQLVFIPGRYWRLHWKSWDLEISSS